jgi:hypothetical protein
MSKDVADAFIGVEIAKISRSPMPHVDHSYVSGMIDMAVMLGQLTYGDGQCYHQALERKVGKRKTELRRAA